jgi:hypothetical protein
LRSWISVPFLLRRLSPVQQILERKEEAQENLRPVPGFVKKVSDVAAETERKEKVETDLRSIVEHRKEPNQFGAVVEINHRQKTSAVFGREPRRGTEDGLVYRDVFWLNLKSSVGNASL